MAPEESSDPPLRYRWERTFAGKPRDFVCIGEHGQQVGRIYYTAGGWSIQPHWKWFLNGVYRNRGMTPSGSEPTRMQAARTLEAEWIAAKARIDALLDGPSVDD